MRCPNCGTDNPPGAQLCAQCTAALPAAGAAPSGEQPPPGSYPPPDPSGYPPPGQQPAPSGGYPAPGAPQPDPGGYPPPGGYPAPGMQGVQGTPSGGYPAPGVPADGYPPPGVPSGGYPAPGVPSGGWAAGGSGSYPPGGGPPASPGSRRSILLVLLGALIVVAVVAGVLVVTGGGGEGEDDEVVLEPIGQVQEDDFAGNLDSAGVGASASVALADFPVVESAPEPTTALASLEAPGTEPGLYGGSRDAAVCDVTQLVAFLTDPANSGQAEAWAETLGTTVEEIPTFVAGLTPVRLRHDTRVTNHGYRDGEANPFQSLLQAGTAVMVDSSGVPRVKCNCGNPLSEPEPVEGSANVTVADVAQNPEAAWDGLDPARVVSVQPADAPVDAFTLVTLEDGQLFDRPVGTNGEADADPADVSTLCEEFTESPTCGGAEGAPLTLGGGNVQITLRWDSNADLDLHVIEPDGNEIYYGNRGPSASGGQLDVDSNISCVLNGAVENVYWPAESPAPAGAYTVEVTGFSVGGTGCGAGDYELTFNVEGQPARTETGSVADGETDSFDLSVS